MLLVSTPARRARRRAVPCTGVRCECAAATGAVAANAIGHVSSCTPMPLAPFRVFFLLLHFIFSCAFYSTIVFWPGYFRRGALGAVARRHDDRRAEEGSVRLHGCVSFRASPFVEQRRAHHVFSASRTFECARRHQVCPSVGNACGAGKRSSPPTPRSRRPSTRAAM